jgi:hypothetical protein
MKHSLVSDGFTGADDDDGACKLLLFIPWKLLLFIPSVQVVLVDFRRRLSIRLISFPVLSDT